MEKQRNKVNRFPEAKANIGLNEFLKNVVLLTLLSLNMKFSAEFFANQAIDEFIGKAIFYVKNVFLEKKNSD